MQVLYVKYQTDSPSVSYQEYHSYSCFDVYIISISRREIISCFYAFATSRKTVSLSIIRLQNVAKHFKKSLQNSYLSSAETRYSSETMYVFSLSPSLIFKSKNDYHLPSISGLLQNIVYIKISEGM